MFNASLQENETVVGKDRVLDRFGEEMERVACLCNAADGTTMQYLLPHNFPVIKCFVTR